MERLPNPELPPLTLDTLAMLVRDWNARGINGMPIQDAMFRSWHYGPTGQRAPAADRFLGDMMWERPEWTKRMMLLQDILGRAPQELWGLGLDVLQQRNR